MNQANTPHLSVPSNHSVFENPPEKSSVAPQPAVPHDCGWIYPEFTHLAEAIRSVEAALEESDLLELDITLPRGFYRYSRSEDVKGELVNFKLDYPEVSLDFNIRLVDLPTQSPVGFVQCQAAGPLITIDPPPELCVVGARRFLEYLMSFGAHYVKVHSIG
jgi:hypothetical protein